MTYSETCVKRTLNKPEFYLVLNNIYYQKLKMLKYNINTKHERDSETRFPYINPSPWNSV